jgi:hypothetical protein
MKMKKEYKKLIIVVAIVAFVAFVAHISLRGTMQMSMRKPYTGSCVMKDTSKLSGMWKSPRNTDVTVQPKEKNMICHFRINDRSKVFHGTKPESTRHFKRFGKDTWIDKDIAKDLAKGKKADAYGVPVTHTPQQATAAIEGVQTSTKFNR